MRRSLAIWVFGLLASGIFGGMVGSHLTYDGGFFGFVGGIFAFICLRLWLTPKST